jgi:hypothetical protein
MKRAPILLTAAALLATATIAVAGAPWLSIEYPTNPMDPETKDAVLVVRTYHHGNVVWFPVTCTAEGIVNGQRRSVPLEVVRTSKPAVYALKQHAPTEGTWVLVINLLQENTVQVSALVELGVQGEVLGAKVLRRPGEQWGRAATPADIESALRARTAVRVAGS